MKIDCADAITLITGTVCVSVDRLYQIYNEFTGDKLYTHVLPRAGRFAEPRVKAQLPKLTAYLDILEFNTDNWQHLVAVTKSEFGDSFEIQTRACDWLKLHPLDEPILDGKQVIAVEVGK